MDDRKPTAATNNIVHIGPGFSETIANLLAGGKEELHVTVHGLDDQAYPLSRINTVLNVSSNSFRAALGAICVSTHRH